MLKARFVLVSETNWFIVALNTIYERSDKLVYRKFENTEPEVH
jgi:hypothetical protein